MLYLPARSNLDVDGGLTVPEDCDIFLWEVNNCEVSCRPNEHPLLPVNHTGCILQTKSCFNLTEMLAPASGTSAHFHFLKKKRRLEVTLTGFPVSSLKVTTD